MTSSPIRASGPVIRGLALALMAGPALAQDLLAPPVCDHNGPYSAECSGSPTAVPVDGSGSFDPDGTPVTFFWFEECGFAFFDDVTSATPNLVVDMTNVCVRDCTIALRVTSGGQTVSCVTTVHVADTTPPSITCPINVDAPWGTPTSPAAMGMAAAADACDPAPAVVFADQVIPQMGPGVEQTIVRTWTATDFCQFTDQCTQTIRLLSPWVGGFNLTADPEACGNHFDRNSADPLFQPVLLGTPRLRVVDIDTTSLRVHKLGAPLRGVTADVQALGTFVDVARARASSASACNPPGPDGLPDLAVPFSRASVIAELDLAGLVPGTQVPIVVTGRRLNGVPFWATTLLTLD